MNILPLNIEAIIRAYPHHLFPHSIMSNNSSEGDLVANIDIISKNSKPLTTIEKNAKFYVSDSNYMLYSDSFSPQSDNIIYRFCEKNDELVVKINEQHYSRNWASICLFITAFSNLESNENQKICDLRFGKCCRDSLFVFDGKNKSFPCYSISKFPY